jgi:hypothetical protein
MRAATRALPRALSAALLSALVACSSPPSHFYTLSAGDQPTEAARTAGNPPLLIEVPPVDVPPQVAKNQFVVQTGPTQVQVLEQERWASLPGDEIRRALSSALTQQLGTIDVYGSPYPDRVPVYRVSVNVQRFESWPGSRTLIDAVWSVRAVRTQAVLTCRSVVGETVSGGYDALADGHRRAVQQISTEIAAAVRNLAASPARGATVSCPASTTGPAVVPSAAPSASNAATKG